MNHISRTSGFRGQFVAPARLSRRVAALLLASLLFAFIGNFTAHATTVSSSLENTTQENNVVSQQRTSRVRALPRPTPNRSTGTAQPGPSPSPTPEATPSQFGDVAGQTVILYYFREATKIAAILNEVAGKEPPTELKGLVITSAGENEIILYGPKMQRERARRIITTLDLPRPGITMEMWGIQISSPKPDKMAEVMPRVRREIDRTQQAVRETYEVLQQLTRECIPNSDLDPNFRSILEDGLYYRTALHSNRPLSLPDILLRMAAAKDPSKAARDIELRLNGWLRDSPYRDYVNDEIQPRSQPFERFFKSRGLYYRNGQWDDSLVTPNALQGRASILEFALHYGRLIHEPSEFSPYFLQQSAEILNARLQDATDALNLDMQELFVAPTLLRIQRIIKDFKDVDYAQVGKTTVASLSGTATEVTSHSVSVVDATPPLRLSDLLAQADKLSKSTESFVPHPTQNLVGAMPLAQVIGLLAAFGEERSVWRELQSGISLTVTPNVLRNMTSAELEINLKTGDPQGSVEKGVRSLSRVSQHDLKTKVYVNALDFFDLSAFASLSTVGGGRGYVPIIGPVWQGLFGQVPVAGKLFSWQRANKTVYHESLVLTNSFVTPTVMGIAVLYPTELTEPRTGVPINYNFAKQRSDVEQYKVWLQRLQRQ
jgi:hypothetical protein